MTKFLEESDLDKYKLFTFGFIPTHTHTDQTSMTDGRKILSDEPRLSSAALSITLKHDGQTFRPEFTHQCVEKEAFDGYQPIQSVLDGIGTEFPSSEKDALVHQSHLQHEQTSNELDIQIHLASSCLKCQVHVNIQPKVERKPYAVVNEPQTKKVKIDDTKIDANKINCTTLVQTVSSGDEITPSTSISQPLSKIQIKDSINKALPEIIESGLDQNNLSKPIGKIVNTYSVNDKDFVLSLADGTSKQVSEYHDQVQKLALWFIENADDVDVSDTQSGFWKILYLFREREGQFTLVGYITLFHFHAPFHKPVPGIIVRICQALVLPPYQGQGHGKRMMKCAYSIVHEKFPECYEAGETIVQLNVEDPAPGFIALRNKVDMAMIAENHKKWWPASATEVSIIDYDFFRSLTESEAVEISALAKITPRQIHIVNELIKLQAVLAHEDNESSMEALNRKYRLLVKRRLLKDHREDWNAIPTRDERKAFMAKLFEEQYKLYQRLLGKSR
jgi:histone acetyltransferase 1